jgi:ABC-type lipopolysaccharide export system ATPase subunit
VGLEGRGLVKRYGNRAVVDRLSLVVEPGRIVGLLGPNGAGKTTTFSLIMGFMSADRGSVLLDGADISDLPFYGALGSASATCHKSPPCSPRLPYGRTSRWRLKGRRTP